MVRVACVNAPLATPLFVYATVKPPVMSLSTRLDKALAYCMDGYLR